MVSRKGLVLLRVLVERQPATTEALIKELRYAGFGLTPRRLKKLVRTLQSDHLLAYDQGQQVYVAACPDAARCVQEQHFGVRQQIVRLERQLRELQRAAEDLKQHPLPQKPVALRIKALPLPGGELEEAEDDAGV